MTILHLVRHGETAWHEGNRYAGSTDVPLDERGAAQALELAAWARGAGLTALVSSDQVRARDTAARVAETTGLELRVDHRLRERAFGVAEGRSPEEQAALDPAARAAFDAAPSSSPMAGGEPGEDVARRAVAGLDDVVSAAGPDGVALVVAHGTLIRLALCAYLGLDLDAYRRVFPVVRNGALTTLRFDAGQVGLVAFNAPV